MAKNNVILEKIVFERWKLFPKIEIDFREPLTIIQGSYGSGKTTILNGINYLIQSLDNF